MTELTVAALQHNLSTHPAPHYYFEEQFNQLLGIHDLVGVQNLIAAAEPLAGEHCYLQQWAQYAHSYLAGWDGQRLDEAIPQLEALRAETDLAPGLRVCVLNALGIVYEMNEQWDRALRCYHECVAIDEADANTLGLASTLQNLATVYWKAQDYPAAIAHAQRSINLLAEKPEDETWLAISGVVWNTLGFAHLRQGALGAAKTAFERSIAICEQCADQLNEGIACNNLAQVYRRLGELAQAEHYYQRAHTLTLATDNFRETAEAVYGLTLLKLSRAAPFAEIQTLLAEALELAQRTNNQEIITDVLLSHAQWQEQNSDLTASLTTTRQAVATVESLRANIMLPDDRARLTASRVEAYEQMVARLLNTQSAAGYAEAFHYAEMAKSRTLIEMLGNRVIRQPQQAPAAWLVQEKRLRQRLHTLYQAGSLETEAIAATEAELNQLRERIRLQAAEFESFQTVDPLTLPAVQTRLPSNSVLIEYFMIGDNIWAFVITPTQVRVCQLPLRVQELQRAFKQIGENSYGFLHNTTRGENHYLRSPWILNNLYQRLIEPLGEVVARAELLAIVPHGLLHYVPFHALYQQTAAGPRYLNEREGAPRPIVYAPNATTLLDYCQVKPISTGIGCFALGHNNHTLTQAEAEAARIVQLVGGASYLNTAATRTALLTEAVNYRYVHLSCHGWFNPVWPLSSSIALADGEFDVADALRELRLNAELVCLSACETGRSHILRGDELIGLARAFLYAGAPAVLVSHWVVDECSTRLLFERFYQELAAGFTPQATQVQPGASAIALSRAQYYLRNLTTAELREILHQQGNTPQAAEQMLDFFCQTDPTPQKQRPLAHPYYWAPFFLVGDRLMGR